jgi:phosphate transport system substrate-binding protein
MFVGLASSVSTVRPAFADDIQGAGSTFVAPIIEKWSDDYAKISGVKVVYQSVGSAAGIKQIQSGDVDFGATDKPLPPDELEKVGLCQFPIVIGGIVPVVNLPGVESGQIKFSRKLIADIYLGVLTSWDAPEIKAVNPGLQLPAIAISVVHRSDGSGTTYNWVDFLAKASAAWKEKVGVGLSVNWPVGVGGDGNAGVAAAVTATPGAIGYVEYAYAVQNKLSFGQVENAHGLFVSPTPETFQAAASTVDWRDFKDFSVLMTDAGGPDAFPITATTFILMYKSPKDSVRSAATLAFFKWALEDGEVQASDLHYVAIPPRLTKLIKAYWASEIASR